MRWTVVLILVVLPTGSALADSYLVVLDAATPRLARVTAELTPTSDGLLTVTRDAADSGIEGGWARFLRDLQARDSKGRSIGIEEIEEGVFHLGQAAGPVRIQYKMQLEHDRVDNLPGADELAWARSDAVFWTGRALFLAGQPTDGIEIDFELPRDWRATTPWEVLDPGHRFRAEDLDALLDSGFILGEHFEARLGGDEAPIRIALAGKGARSQSDLIVETVQRYASRFGELFGGPAEGRMLLVAADGGFWGGGVMGTTISMMLGGQLDASTLPMLRFVTVHEAFHLWNANFRYREPEGIESLYWLSEGSASYYTLRAQLGLGDLTVEEALAQLADEVAKYRTARGELSMVAAGPTKLEHYDLIYSGGFAATMALDLAIRARSLSDHSLDDVMRSLHSGAGRSVELDIPVFADLVQSTTGVSVADLLTCCIEGTDELPLADLFGVLGLVLHNEGERLRIEIHDDADATARQQWSTWPLGP